MIRIANHNSQRSTVHVVLALLLSFCIGFMIAGSAAASQGKLAPEQEASLLQDAEDMTDKSVGSSGQEAADCEGNSPDHHTNDLDGEQNCCYAACAVALAFVVDESVTQQLAGHGGTSVHFDLRAAISARLLRPPRV